MKTIILSVQYEVAVYQSKEIQKLTNYFLVHGILVGCLWRKRYVLSL